MFKYIKTIITTVSVATIATTFVPTTASAALEAGYIYELNNHPDGNAAPPGYGLRLDGLYTGSTHNVWTFDFNDSRSDMRLAFDGNTIRIYGQSYGGLDVGSSYFSGLDGVATIDFLYTDIQTVSGDDDFISLTSRPLDSGTISMSTARTGAFSRDLTEYAGNNAFTFRIGDENDDNGHRQFSGISGWGWLNHSGSDRHVYASDWLFTVGRKVAVIPEPGTYLMLGTCLAFVGLARRRRATLANG